MRINFTIAYIQYSLSNLCSAKLSLVIAQEGFVSVAARRDTETTLHHSATLKTETPPNSASISGPSKTTTSNILFPGAFSHRTCCTTAQAKDVTSASKKSS